MTEGTEEPESTVQQSLWERIKTDSEASKRIRDAIIKDLTPYTDRLTESVERVSKLLSTADQLTSQLSSDASHLEDQNREAAQDILRAAVVLMHAYLEDFLRTIARSLLPAGDENCLAGIPLAGLSGRPDKFHLGKLVHHKGKSVDEVLRESVSEHLDRSNFNSTQELALLLEKLGFDVAEHSQEFPLINHMIQRRHYIVHRADRVKATDSDNYVLQPILGIDVRLYLESTTSFMSGLMRPVLLKLNPLEELTKRLNIDLPEGTKK